MGFHDIWKKYENYMIVLLTIVANIVLMSCYFDFYYDLNDDVLMKNIISGSYTGTPDGHDVFMHYILGFFISLCYRLCRDIPWYGLFLLVCQMGSMYLIGVRLLRLCTKYLAKAGCMICLTMFLWAILPHMIAVQFTIVSGIVAAAAVFLFITTERGLPCKVFVIRNIPSILLAVLSYQIRTEMLIFVLPIICMAGLFHWIGEKKFFEKENFCKYGAVLGFILLGMFITRLVDLAAYGSEEWKSFLVLCDKRAEVYDYHGDALSDTEFMSSLGLGAAQQKLLLNYNIGLDEEIDAQVMSKIAECASENGSEITGSLGIHSSLSFSQRLLEQGKEYILRNLKGGDAPYNRFALCGYFCVALTGIFSVFANKTEKRRWLFLWELIALGVVRTALWMFILMRGRTPNRITHPLYLVEAALLLGMLCMQFLQSGKYVVFVLYALLCIRFVPDGIQKTFDDNRLRKEINRDFYAIAEYCQQHPEYFYFEDVASIAAFSQEIFKNVDNSLSNYDFAGGWLCKSPLYREKLEQFEIETMEEGLLTEDSAYFIMTRDGSMDWMREYYAEKEIRVGIEQIDVIGDSYAVYQVIKDR